MHLHEAENIEGCWFKKYGGWLIGVMLLCLMRK